MDGLIPKTGKHESAGAAVFCFFSMHDEFVQQPTSANVCMRAPLPKIAPGENLRQGVLLCNGG